MQDAIKLFWWRGSPNLGDAIAPAIVSHVSGRRVTWSPRHEAELFSTGSIIDVALDLHGLLVGELTGVVKSTLPRYRAGRVVHQSQKLQPGLPDRLVARGVTCIVGATDDYRSVAQQMAECEVILSNSLHGLVFADALGIPNTCMMPDGIHQAARFKFHDYACASGACSNRLLNLQASTLPSTPSLDRSLRISPGFRRSSSRSKRHFLRLSGWHPR
jgi:hypothetical protein